MSEQLKHRTGLILLWTAVIICLLLLLWNHSAPKQDSYTASGRESILPEPVFPSGTIRINQADAEELQELLGIGETLSAMILEERNKNGPFFYPEDLISVKGIGKQKLKQIVEYLDFEQEEGR